MTDSIFAELVIPGLCLVVFTAAVTVEAAVRYVRRKNEKGPL